MPTRTSFRDDLLNKKVMQQLSNRGVRPPCQVVVSNSDGSITLSGQIEHEYQRRSAVRAAQNTAGVKRVLDKLQVVSKTLHQQQRGCTPPYLQV
jgi:osmotically-inducible protein OsmY